MIREEFVQNATLVHGFYSRSMVDICLSTSLSLQNASRSLLYELYSCVEKFDNIYRRCIECYALDGKTELFATRFSEKALQSMVEYCGLNVELCGKIPKKQSTVGRSHKIFDIFCKQNQKALNLLEKIESIFSVVSKSENKIFCTLPKSILEYFEYIQKWYSSAIKNLQTKDDYSFFVPASFLRTHARFLINSLDKVYCNSVLYSSLEKFVFEDNCNNDDYGVLLERLASCIVHKSQDISTTIQPILADHFLRYSKAAIVSKYIDNASD